MRIVVVGSSDFITGFQLAGIKEVYEAEDEWKAKNVLEDIKDMRDVAIVIIPKRYAYRIRNFIDDWKREKGIYPVILELPDMHEREKYEDYMREIVKRALGIDILKR